MKFEQRVVLPWLLFSAVVLCGWCSSLSAIGGWVMGQDIARREAQATAAAATSSNLPPLGVLVTRLVRDGPAAQAGIQRGDLVVAIDAVHVQDARELRERLTAYHAGDRVRLSVVRDRSETQLEVQLAAFPGDNQRVYLGMYYTARGDEPADL